MKILILLIIYICIVLRTQDNLQVFQQNYYNENNRYIKWIFKNRRKIINYLDIILLLINGLNIVLQNNYVIYLNIIYIIDILISIKKRKNVEIKLPLKYTFRIIRLCFTIFIINIIPFILFIFNHSYYLLILNYSILLIFNFFIIYLSNIINIPIEKYVFNYYKNIAKKKLKDAHTEVIGITGSYGKTSTKNILNTILNVKYNSITTPGSYNTLYGLIITINNKLNKFNEYFIAEMGAFRKGSIKKLCDLVEPKYGIITNIGKAHLETFGSIDNIKKGKFELIDSLPDDGVAILNMDDENQSNYNSRSKCKKIWISIDKDSDVKASNIKVSTTGMIFDVYFKENNESHTFTTKLLGYSNIYNILSAIALGKHLGMTINELDIGVKQIKPIEHRLELKNINNITIIDDAYNSNPIGSKMALDVLKLFEGLKVVVTPGMIELGNEQDKLNRDFGVYISKCTNIVILVGREQTKSIYDGLIDSKFKKENIYIIDNFNESLKIIEDLKNKYKKINVLLENDLPDIYNEK